MFAQTFSSNAIKFKVLAGWDSVDVDCRVWTHWTHLYSYWPFSVNGCTCAQCAVYSMR